MLFFFKQKTAYEMRISDWSSDVCSSDLVSVSLAGSWSVIDIVRADGFSASDIRPLVRLNVSVILEENGRRESGVFGMGGRYLYDDLFKPESWSRAIDEAIAQASVNLRSVAAPAGEMTVLLGPGWPGVLLHEAVGHGLEGEDRKSTRLNSSH